MKVDPKVSKIKFAQEVKLVHNNEETLKKWGVVIQEAKYPVVKAIFIPSFKLKLTLPAKFPPGTPLPPEIKLPENLPQDTQIQAMMTSEIQNLSARAFGTIISLDDFDQRAPSVIFCDPFTWEEIPYNNLIRGHHVGDKGKAFNVILGNHPLTKRPFLCMRGIREYHEHPQHTGDEWMQYRKHCGLFSTIHTIWKTCIFNSRPNLVLQPPNIVVFWEHCGIS